ncbi:hypothetical protein Halha_1964 [Halobacteroides halobius DSM 5150]|uniref:Uncharacterized protein n=1 Tax=Halobacteroides halobius (strain ATCC 35273 / DSM 5150 / MD-1) TaxID=748449 RepID=L0KBF4_HALHC|nr:hypothetical protein [Halobacteroides halobius]AGB41865.1 hypothetical protein Halha_1964 [Halobacteroides halobius DSM 5150]
MDNKKSSKSFTLVLVLFALGLKNLSIIGELWVYMAAFMASLGIYLDFIQKQSKNILSFWKVLFVITCLIYIWLLGDIVIK